MARPLPGLIDVAKTHGLRCAAVHNWEPLRNLSQPGSLYTSYYIDNCYTDRYGDHHMAHTAVRMVEEEMPDFLFAYFGTVDVAGHKYGWMSAEYRTQLARVDAALGVLCDGLPEDATILVQSDHGGHERTHGTDSPEDMTIPWIVVGPGIREDYEIEGAVSLLDTAPTLATILGIPLHRDWEGRCVEEIFRDDMATE
jgi:predicted AlkP superfamily pyrophosphatase or phosphodiesterase